jgi:hypothetical protein
MLSDAQRKGRKQELHEKIAGHTPYAVLRNNIDPPWIGLTLRKLAATRRLTKGREQIVIIFLKSRCMVWGLAALLGLSLPAMAVANPLDGRRYIGPTGEKGEEAYGDEELTFYDGKLYSVDCARWGFGEGIVTTRTADDGIHFTAETRSEKYGKIVWEGIVQGDRIEAVYTWRKQGWFVETVREYWFKGTRQP